MLTIRLQRVGRRGDPAHRIVVQDSHRSPKSGRVVEVLGSYNPRHNQVAVNTEHAAEWIGKGATVSGTVHNIFIDQGIIKGSKKNVLPKKQPIVAEKEEEAEEKKETAETSEASSEESTEDTETEDGTADESVKDETDAPEAEEKTDAPAENSAEPKEEEVKEEDSSDESSKEEAKEEAAKEE